MPYSSVSEVPESIPAEFRKEWLEVFNSVYAEAKKDGKPEKECEALAFEQANGVIKKARQQSADLYRAQFSSRVVQAADPEGRAWEVEITRAGVNTSQRLEWPPEVLRRDAQVFEGVPSYVDHLSLEEMKQGKGRSIQDLIGWIRQPRMGETALLGTLHLLEPEKWAPKLRAIQAAPEGIGGMSLDVFYRAEAKAGLALGRVIQIVKALSVDLVSRPDGGGRILRAVAGQDTNFEEFRPDTIGTGPTAEFDSTARTLGKGTRDSELGTRVLGEKPMKEKIERILQAIRRFDAAKATALEAEIKDLEENERYERANQALLALEPPKPVEPVKVEPPAPAPLVAADKALLERATASIEQAEQIRCEAVLQKALAASSLPVPLQEEVARRYKDKTFKVDELEEDIKQIRQTFARVVPENRMASPTVRITMQEEDKMQIALDRLFGLTHELKIETDPRGIEKIVQGNPLPHEIPAFRSLRQAYVAYTSDPDVTGETKFSRIMQIFNTAGFPYALASTLNRLLLRDYAAAAYRQTELVSRITAPSDFRNQERIRVGYFGDLSTVGEDEEYEEIPAVTDERISYAVATRGNLLTVTRRTIINDDLGFVAAQVAKLGRSAARTLAKYIWSFAISNGTYDADGLAWFHGTHGNLGATGLSATIATSVALLDIVDLAFFNMTEKDSGEKLALSGPYLLVVPKAIHSIAIAINQAEYQDAVFTPNPWYHAFGVNNERIFPNPFYATELNDWMIFDVSGNVDLLEIGFLQGRQNPEFFLADQPTAEAMFHNDRMIYKVRHEYAGDILDYRGGYKAVVT
jgi:hypothetical protein